MDKRGMDMPKASGSRTGNLLAGLGKMVADNFSGKRGLMLDEARQRSRAEIDIARQLSVGQGKLDIARQAAGDPAFDPERTGIKSVTGIFDRQAIVKYGKSQPTPTGEDGGTPSSGNTKGSQFGQPTTEDAAPKSSSSKMKSTKSKKPSVKTSTPSGQTTRRRKPYVTKKEVSEAVTGGKIQEAEGLGLNKAYDSMVAKREDSAGKIDTSPKIKKTAKPKKPSTSKNGNSGTTNGNKTGGM
jgi:hypothetical protein